MSEKVRKRNQASDRITTQVIRDQVCSLDNSFHNLSSRRESMPIGYHDVIGSFSALEHSLSVFIDGIVEAEEKK